MEVSFWNDPARYVANSPFTFLPQVKMPLLLFQPRPSPTLSFGQDRRLNPGRQMFENAKHLGKQVMLVNSSPYLREEEDNRVLFWLEESILPEVAIYLPLAVGRLLMTGSVLVAAWLAVRRRRTLNVAATVAGAGHGWALHEISPLILCRSDVLYRPCTSSEVGWMVLPPIVLILLAAGTVAHALLRRDRTHPA